MRDLLLILIPLLAAGAAFAWPDERTRPRLLPVAGALHAGLTLWLLASPPQLAAGAWFGFDRWRGRAADGLAAVPDLCAVRVAYLRIRTERRNRVFVTALLAALGLLSLALQAQNLGLLWVAAEAVTLVTVPLLHFNRTARAFEAS